MLNKTQRSVISVLEKIKTQVQNSEEDAEVYAEELDIMLDALLQEDMFGTEGQTDPRGDQREGPWTMFDLQEKN